MRDDGLAGFVLILRLSGRAHIAEQLIRVPVRLVGGANADVGALRVGLADEGGVVVLGVLGAGLALERGVVVKRGFCRAVDGQALAGLQVVVLSDRAGLDRGLAAALVLVPLGVLRALLALLGCGVPVRSGLVALLAVQGVGVPEGRLGRAHADLPTRAVVVALLCRRVEHLVRLAVDIHLTFLCLAVVGLVLGAVQRVLQAAVAGGRPGLVFWAGLALVGGAVVGRRGLGAFVAGEVAGAPERGCGRALRVGASGRRGVARVVGVGVVVRANRSAAADLSTSGAVCGLIGDELAVLGLLAEVASLGAVEQDQSLVDAIFSVLLPDLVLSAAATGLDPSIEKGCFLRAFDAGQRLHVPNWSFLGATGIRAQVYLTFLGLVAEELGFLAGAVVVALVRLEVEDEAFGLAGGHALSAAEVEERQFCRAGDALVVGEVGKWSSLRALSEVGSSGALEDVEAILLFIGAAVEPGIGGDQIIPVDVVHDLAALGSDGVPHNLDIVLHLADLPPNLLHGRALPLRTLRILVHVPLLVAPQRPLQVGDGLLHVLDLRLDARLDGLREVDALAGAEREGNVEIPLDIEERISLIGQVFLEEDDFVGCGDVGICELEVDGPELVVDGVEVVPEALLHARQLRVVGVLAVLLGVLCGLQVQRTRTRQQEDAQQQRQAGAGAGRAAEDGRKDHH